jgi:hypothetical protein
MIQDQYTDLPISRCAKWRLRHPEWHSKYRESHRKSTKKYRSSHREKLKNDAKDYRSQHKIQSRNQGKIWRCKNPNKTREYKAKRRYNLKFLSINNWFVGSVGHHITKEYVMYIPKELHRSVSHNIHTGFNMNLINYEAFKWYYGFKP